MQIKEFFRSATKILITIIAAYFLVSGVILVISSIITHNTDQLASLFFMIPIVLLLWLFYKELSPSSINEGLPQKKYSGVVTVVIATLCFALNGLLFGGNGGILIALIYFTLPIQILSHLLQYIKLTKNQDSVFNRILHFQSLTFIFISIILSIFIFFKYKYEPDYFILTLAFFTIPNIVINSIILAKERKVKLYPN